MRAMKEKEETSGGVWCGEGKPGWQKKGKKKKKKTKHMGRARQG